LEPAGFVAAASAFDFAGAAGALAFESDVLSPVVVVEFVSLAVAVDVAAEPVDAEPAAAGVEFGFEPHPTAKTPVRKRRANWQWVSCENTR